MKMEIIKKSIYTKQLEDKLTKLEEENKKLKKYYDRDKEELMESCYSLVKENDELKKENKNLKSDLAFERTMLDNVKAEYKSLQNVNKKLEEDVDYRHHRAMVAERG